MPRTKTFTEEEIKKRKNQSTQKTIQNHYKQYKINVRKEEFYIWTKYAESKGISVYAMVKQAVEAAVEKDGFTPDIPYSEIENSDQ